MKKTRIGIRRLSLVLGLVLLLGTAATAFAFTYFSQPQHRFSVSGGTVYTYLSATGKDASTTTYINAVLMRKPEGVDVWAPHKYYTDTATGFGTATINASCAAESGASYKLNYSVQALDADGNKLESTSGTLTAN